jgi:hypothetical protein
VLRKKGFKDQKLTVQPDHDREYVLELSSTRRSGSSGKPDKDKPDKPVAPPTATKPAAAPEVPKNDPKAGAGKLRDLKDPFAN